MKPILWVDAQILKFFTKIAKDFNWLTGKDNFFLARVVIVVMALRLLCPFNWLNLAVGIIMCSSLQFVTKAAETIVSLEQKNGAKDRLKYLVDRAFRLCSWLMVAFAVAMVGILDPPAQVAIFTLPVAYLVSIDRPPFKKSQAWQKIKNWAGSSVAQPQVETIPVVSN